ncbi:Shikimate kinase [Beutenbergia cavernae DSM 12333]|uniref:Shikimate kinase n=1 Tax=Beutenbergia cavernae (strain ATCC BAA-8 / DSM 12333 / CCUG 43141 / JCM 11478 / NBRC 16432 / NCIMB 13614 / HKI 0122) TaxID=471853 RepID=C5C5T4_BEUC1|nr:shikimate kinase [Beutenbergia cavernae]ACQ80275.1 Shikimate kinase [Beutenbergia cavernae DSM 12333]
MTRPRVVLVGPPGSGKTTVSALLAAALGVDVRDTDADVEATAGRPITEIFVDDGEDAFRDLERAAVAAALAEHDGVLALGGGAVLDAGTRAKLAEHTVVYLEVSLTSAAPRVGLDRSRPLLLGNPRAQWKKLMDARRPLYEEVAAISVSTDSKSPDDVAAEILAALGRAEAAR